MFTAFNRIQPGEDHRIDGLEAGQRLRGQIGGIHDGVTDLGVAHLLDVGHDEPDFPSGQLIAGDGFRRLVAEAFHFIGRVVGAETEFLAAPHSAVDHAHEDDDAAIGVEPGIENEGAERGVDIAFGRRNLLNDLFQDGFDADALFSAAENGFGRVEPDDLFDLLHDPFRLGGWQVYLVDNREYFQIQPECQIRIGERLGLDALAGVNDKQGAFAGLKRAGDFIGKVNVTGRVDKV